MSPARVIPNGGPAFPIPPHLDENGGPDSYWSSHPHPGMSLRDWFAGQALAGLLANPTIQARHPEREREIDLLAEGAYVAAEAMLQRRHAEQRQADARALETLGAALQAIPSTEPMPIDPVAFNAKVDEIEARGRAVDRATGIETHGERGGAQPPVRTDVYDGWEFTHNLRNDLITMLCPEHDISLVWARGTPCSSEPVPLGGNGVPEHLTCGVCGEQARNPS